MYSLSTCWNSGRHTDGRLMLREIRDLGFDYAELSHGIRLSLVPGILEALQAGEIKISTLHNFCPLPMGVNHPAPNLYKFTSDNTRERDAAWKHTLNTLEKAHQFGAKLVVLHSGSIDLKDYDAKLEEMKNEMGEKRERVRQLEESNQQDTREYRKLVSKIEDAEDDYRKLVQKVEEKRDKYKTGPMQRSLDMIGRLAEQAGSYGLMLGIENREAVHEIPFDHEIMEFLQGLPPNVKYWHDCGHAQIKEHLEFIPSHEMHLQTMASRLAGFHIHDVVIGPEGAHDHCPPGSGVIRWENLKQFVRPDHIKVLELSPGVPVDDVRRGYETIRGFWGPE